MGHIINPTIYRVGKIQPWVSNVYNRQSNIQKNYAKEDLIVYNYTKNFFLKRVYKKVINKVKGLHLKLRIRSKNKVKFGMRAYLDNWIVRYSHLTMSRINKNYSLNLFFFDRELQKKNKLRDNQRVFKIKNKKIRQIKRKLEFLENKDKKKTINTKKVKKKIVFKFKNLKYKKEMIGIFLKNYFLNPKESTNLVYRFNVKDKTLFKDNTGIKPIVVKDRLLSYKKDVNLLKYFNLYFTKISSLLYYNKRKKVYFKSYYYKKKKKIFIRKLRLSKNYKNFISAINEKKRIDITYGKNKKYKRMKKKYINIYKKIKKNVYKKMSKNIYTKKKIKINSNYNIIRYLNKKNGKLNILKFKKVNNIVKKNKMIIESLLSYIKKNYLKKINKLEEKTNLITKLQIIKNSLSSYYIKMLKKLTKNLIFKFENKKGMLLEIKKYKKFAETFEKIKDKINTNNYKQEMYYNYITNKPQKLFHNLVLKPQFKYYYIKKKMRIKNKKNNLNINLTLLDLNSSSTYIKKK